MRYYEEKEKITDVQSHFSHEITKIIETVMYEVYHT